MKQYRCVDFHAHPVTDAFRRAMDQLGIDVIAEDGFPGRWADVNLYETPFVRATAARLSESRPT